jgi:hypothetical protein
MLPDCSFQAVEKSIWSGRFSFGEPQGQRSTAKCERFLSSHDKLLCSLPNFEVVYVATTPEHFQQVMHLFKLAFPVVPATSLKIPAPIGGQKPPTRPRAGLVTELIKASYPLFLNQGPVHGPVQDVRRQYIQTPLFSSEVPNDVV